MHSSRNHSSPGHSSSDLGAPDLGASPDFDLDPMPANGAQDGTWNPGMLLARASAGGAAFVLSLLDALEAEARRHMLTLTLTLIPTLTLNPTLTLTLTPTVTVTLTLTLALTRPSRKRVLR